MFEYKRSSGKFCMNSYLWRCCASSSTLLELLQEHFPQNHVILVSENNNISSIMYLAFEPNSTELLE